MSIYSESDVLVAITNQGQRNVYIFALFVSMLFVLDYPILLYFYVITNHFLKRKIMNSPSFTNLDECTIMWPVI